jgi:uncharacterized protein (DUF1015 family)
MSSDGLPIPPGLVLQPFRALRYSTDSDLTTLLSPPYDVISDARRAELEARSLHNAVHLILPREPSDGGSGSRYTAAAALLRTWTAEHVLVRDEAPALYLYEQTNGDAVFRGLLGAVALARAEAGIVLPHENTMTGPVSDRLALTEATEANLEPIYLVYAGDGGVAALTEPVLTTEPVLDVRSVEDGAGGEGPAVRHRIWAITDPSVLAQIAADLLPRRATIADGHHRYATYLRYQEEQHAAGRGAGGWDAGLAWLVDATSSGPEVHAIHRVVPGLSFASATDRARRGFRVRGLPVDADITDQLALAGSAGPAFVVTDGASAALLTDPEPFALDATVPHDRSVAWRNLDVTIAHHLLIRDLWELDDREGVVDFAHDVTDALEQARARAGVAVLLNPTPVASVAAIAEAGERMPRKSTLFMPKPATGLLFRPLAP